MNRSKLATFKIFKDRENGQIRRQLGSSEVFPTSAKYFVQENFWTMRHGTEFCFAHPMSGENKLFIYSYKKRSKEHVLASCTTLKMCRTMSAAP